MPSWSPECCCTAAGYRNIPPSCMCCGQMAQAKHVRHPAGGNGKQMFGDAWWLLLDAPPAPGQREATSPQPLVSTQPTGAVGVSSDQKAQTHPK